MAPTKVQRAMGAGETGAAAVDVHTPPPRETTPTPTTPPLRGKRRPKTPPAPTHGPLVGDYEPYASTSPSTNSFESSSSRRSKASTATSFSTPRRGHERKARPAHLVSPPTSPGQGHSQPSPFTLNTPRRAGEHKHDTISHLSANHHSTHLDIPNRDSASMMLTPSKTPLKKRTTKQTPSRVMTYQPEDANELMPKPRKIKMHSPSRQATSNQFELYEEDLGISRNQDDIDIFTDTNARVPEIDISDDNPFLGSSRQETHERRRSKRTKKTPEQLIEEANMEEAVARGEGMVFTFRGKKVFRPFDNVSQQPDSPVGGVEQRTLRRAAGITSDRPFTRSQMKPRLLFPSTDRDTMPMASQISNGDSSLHTHTDSEADTDIEPSVSRPSTATQSERPHNEASLEAASTPKKSRATPHSPPQTGHRSSKRHAKDLLNTIPEDIPEATTSREGSPLAPSSDASSRPRSSNPFDSWRRTKSRAAPGPSAKRRAEPMEGSSAGAAAKRARSADRFVTP